MENKLSEEELADMDRALEAVMGQPPDAHRRVSVERGALDEIFRTRSRVHVLRAVFRDGSRENLSGSEVGRRARVSHPRALGVLRQLADEGIVTAFRSPGYAIYERNPEHRSRRSSRRRSRSRRV